MAYTSIGVVPSLGSRTRRPGMAFAQQFHLVADAFHVLWSGKMCRVNHALDTRAGNQGCSFEYGKKQRDRDTDVENESGHDMRERAVAKSGTRSRKM